MKAVIHKAHRENASIFETEIIDTCLVVFYYYSGVTPIIKKHAQEKATALKK